MRQERHFFFRTAGEPLFATLHLPAGGAAGRPALVVCDSLFEEKYWCERVFANLGRAAAAAGAVVLVFDYAGYGNSAGDPVNVDPDTLRRDVLDACGFVRGLGVSSVSLLGIRWGAAVAAAAAGPADARALFLVQPIREWFPVFRRALRANVAGQYAIFKKTVMTRDRILEELATGGDCEYGGYRMNNIEGYRFSNRFVEGARETVLDGASCAGRPVTIIRIPEKAGAPVADDGLAGDIAAAGGECEEIVIHDDNAFWINNRIFTSSAPGFVRAVVSRLVESGPDGDGNDLLQAGKVSNAVDDLPGAAAAVEIGGVREEAVVIRDEETGPVAGVFYLPAGPSRATGAVFTHGGLIGMNGAFRFNTRAARRLAAAGHPCLCADTRGTGRSGSSLENVEQRILFRQICNGLFAGDVVAAADALKTRTGVGRVSIVGVCGGAITGILAQSRSDLIDDSVLLSIPVMYPSLRYGEVRMSEGYARFYLGLYLRKIFNPKAWWRLLTFRSEYDKIFAAAAGALKGVFRRLGGGGRRDAHGGRSGEGATDAPAHEPPAVKSGLSVAVPGAGDDMSFNDAFLDAYRHIVDRGATIDFVFGEHDNFRWEFESEFRDRMPAEIERGTGLVTIDAIEHANHMYTLREWQDAIIARCEARFSGSG